MSTGLPELLRRTLCLFVAVPLLAALGTGAIAHANYDYDKLSRVVAATHDAPRAATALSLIHI